MIYGNGRVRPEIRYDILTGFVAFPFVQTALIAKSKASAKTIPWTRFWRRNIDFHVKSAICLADLKSLTAHNAHLLRHGTNIRAVLYSFKMKKHFTDRLIGAIRKKKNPICVGLDPRLSQVPQFIN